MRLRPRIVTTFRGWTGLGLLAFIGLTTLPAVAIADEAQLLRYRVRPGALVDLGWTGIAHGQSWPADQILTFGLTCSEGSDSCALGRGKVGDPFGAPIPLSAGGAPACLVNRLREAVGGTMQRKKGCAEIQLKLTSRVHMAQDVARPCPICEGDPTANDARREGRCSDGARAGEPCDAHAASRSFGATSNDCLPAGSGVGDLSLDVVLSTGKVAIEGGKPCVNLLPGGTCVCEAQLQKNGCRTGTCAADGHCRKGPFDGVCDHQPYRTCMPGSGAKDCEARNAGAGTCDVRTRPCFDETITTEGTCHPTTPTFVATFCAAATRASALNASAGLPGPARLTLPLELLP